MTPSEKELLRRLRKTLKGRPGGMPIGEFEEQEKELVKQMEAEGVPFTLFIMNEQCFRYPRRIPR